MNVLVIDDHPLIVEGITAALAELGSTDQIFSANDPARAVEMFRERDGFGLVVMDLALSGSGGVELIRQLRSHRPEVPIVVLSANDSRETITTALSAGAMGFISKQSTTPVLLSAIQLVLSGGIYIPPQVLGSNIGNTAESPADRGRKIRTLGLTERQTEVLALLLEGKPNKLICRELNVSEGTVKTHVSAILRALNVSNRAQVSYAINRMGLPLPVRGNSFNPLS